MITPLGWLERVPTFKERLRDMAERDIANLGLLGYPLLQTVDIAIVRGEMVPVGEDQLPHLELSREIVRRFNRLYGDVLVEPQPLLSESPLLPGSDGQISKSLDNTIDLDDDPDTIRARCGRSSQTRRRSAVATRPAGVCPIYALPQVLSRHPRVDRRAMPDGELGCVDCKTNLADRIIEQLAPFRERRAELAAKPGLVADVLAAGADRVRPVVESTMAAVRNAMHFA
jgi:tryptophanyl-tRNA synthetase